MSTSNSPHHVLVAEAKKIVKKLKQTAFPNPQVKFAIVQDDKILTIELSREDIKNLSEKKLVEIIVEHTSGKISAIRH